MSIQKFDLTEAEAGETLVDVRCTGTCGSDDEYYHHFQCGAFLRRESFVKIGTISASVITVNELDVRGTFHCVNDFPRALHLLAEGKIPAIDIVTATHTFADSPEAFRAAVGGEELKVQVERSLLQGGLR